MRNLHRLRPVALALILGLASSSCLYTKRVILRRGKPVTAKSAPPLLTATRDELNSRIAAIYGAINSFQATVDMTPSIGSVYKGEITEIHDVTAYILFRKPDDIRIIGQVPIVRTRAFDMVSNGRDFRLYLVSKNLFIEGSNSAPPTSPNKLENLRPAAFLNSMLIRPAMAEEHPELVDNTDEDNAFYILFFVHPDFSIARSVWFDRVDLSITRQMVYDASGSIISDTRYARWQPYSGVMFPGRVDINRPQDGYGVVMDLTEMKMNVGLPADRFDLEQPEGAKLQVIGSPGQVRK